METKLCYNNYIEWENIVYDRTFNTKLGSCIFYFYEFDVSSQTRKY